MSELQRLVQIVVAFVIFHAALFGLGFVGAQNKGLDHALQLVYGSMGTFGIIFGVLLLIAAFVG